MAISRAALVDYFRRRAVDRVTEVRALRSRLTLTARATPEPDAMDAEAAVRTLAHQLAGTAAGFGFPAIGDLAKTVELAPSEGLVASLDELLAALEAVAASDGGTAPPDTE